MNSNSYAMSSFLSLPIHTIFQVYTRRTHGLATVHLALTVWIHRITARVTFRVPRLIRELRVTHLTYNRVAHPLEVVYAPTLLIMIVTSLVGLPVAMMMSMSVPVFLPCVIITERACLEQVIAHGVLSMDVILPHGVIWAVPSVAWHQEVTL